VAPDLWGAAPPHDLESRLKPGDGIAPDAATDRKGFGLARGARALYIAAVLAIAGWMGLHPTFDWDLLAYSGCVEELLGSDPEARHAAAYAQLADLAPPEAVQELHGKYEYRQRLAEEPEAFNAQLPFYRGRVLFIGAVGALSKLGLSPLRTAFLLSLLAGVLMALALHAWLARYLAPIPAAVASLAGLLVAGWAQTMSMATPDMLAATLLVGGAYLLVEERRHAVGLVLLVSAILARADHVILVGPLVIWTTFFREGERRLPLRAALLTGLASLGALWIATIARGTYGWWTVFHHTFGEYMTYPASETPPRDLGLWIGRVARSLPMFKSPQPLVFTLIALGALIWGWRQARRTSDAAGLALTSLLAVGVHFTLFPALWPRLFLAYWLLGLVALAMAASRRELTAPST